jgi:hypothetical protein
LLHNLPHRQDVCVQVPVELLVAELREGLHFEALIAVEHVHRQQPPDVRDVHRDVVVRPNPVELIGLAVLTEQVNFMPLLRERLGEARVVDVRPGPVEQVAVKDQDAHSAQRYCARRCRTPSRPIA